MSNMVDCERCGSEFDISKEEERTDKHPVLMQDSISDSDVIYLCPACLEALKKWFKEKEKNLCPTCGHHISDDIMLDRVDFDDESPVLIECPWCNQWIYVEWTTTFTIVKEEV